MKISCDKAAEICTKSQYSEASWWQILKLKLHISYCKTCANFSAKNTKFSSLCEAAKLSSLDESDKESMKEALKKEL
ncbi:hypothetical protein [uncultured Croceitalea sp.]|uniref:hypothetical protein n=1 Tax=uncultured Croceitalea sp. TaxID=1798908 RepID=UPI00374F8D4F